MQIKKIFKNQFPYLIKLGNTENIVKCLLRLV